jgi:hypothetical protein
LWLFLENIFLSGRIFYISVISILYNKLKKSNMKKTEKKIDEKNSKECEIWVTAVEPDNQWDNPGHWTMYKPTIKLSILLRKESRESDLILDKLKSGDFTVALDGADFCAELANDVLAKDSIISKASESKDLDEFIEDLQEEVYYATLDWYRENYKLDEDDEGAEDAWNGDGINDDALSEITRMGGKGWKLKK